jgi:hypothetical protein
MSIFCPEFTTRGKTVGSWSEPGYINYERRHGGDRVLEAVGVGPFPGGREFIMTCGMGGSRTLWIKWYAHDVEEARRTFREWLAQPWQTMTTDLDGGGIPNGVDFKPGRIDWFNIAG